MLIAGQAHRKNHPYIRTRKDVDQNGENPFMSTGKGWAKFASTLGEFGRSGYFIVATSLRGEFNSRGFMKTISYSGRVAEWQTLRT